MVLPMLAVKGDHRHFFDGSRFQAAHVDAVTVRVRSRNIERFDAACFTEHVLRHTGVEGVSRKRFRTLDKSETGLWHDEMQKPALAADRAVAFNGVDLGLSFNLELYPAAMASAAVFDQVTLFLSPPGYAAASICLLYKPLRAALLHLAR
jgi:hypothetical protein